MYRVAFMFSERIEVDSRPLLYTEKGRLFDDVGAAIDYAMRSTAESRVFRFSVINALTHDIEWSSGSPLPPDTKVMSFDEWIAGERSKPLTDTSHGQTPNGT